MDILRNLLLIVAIVLAGALLGAGMYEQFVMAPNYRANIPESLNHAKQFMSVVNPGNLFRVLAPATQVTLLVTLLLNWGVKSRRWLVLVAFLLAVSADVITFSFHYPRNAILFGDPMNTPVDVLTTAAGEWLYGNAVRCLLLLASVACTILAAMRLRINKPEGFAT